MTDTAGLGTVIDERVCHFTAHERGPESRHQTAYHHGLRDREYVRVGNHMPVSGYLCLAVTKEEET